jgi:MFS family permease
VREPHRHERISAGAAPAAAVVRYFKENRRVVLYHHAGFAFLALGGYSAGAWNAAFFMRAHGWGAQQTGIALGLISLIAGPAGAIVGGRLADRLVARGRRDATLRISACAMLIGAAVTPVIYAVSSAKLSAALVVPASVALSICSGLGASSLQQMMPNEMRGQASAIFTLVITMTGLGAGPTLPALLTDYVFRNENSIGTALAIVVGICWLAASILLMKACRPFISTLDTLNRRLADGTAQAAAI